MEPKIKAGVTRADAEKTVEQDSEQRPAAGQGTLAPENDSPEDERGCRKTDGRAPKWGQLRHCEPDRHYICPREDYDK